MKDEILKAIQDDDGDKVRLLIQQHPDVKDSCVSYTISRTSKPREMPVIALAACLNKEKALKALIDSGAKLNARSSENELTALMCAARDGHYEAFATLIEAKADLLLLEKDAKWTAFDYARDFEQRTGENFFDEVIEKQANLIRELKETCGVQHDQIRQLQNRNQQLERRWGIPDDAGFALAFAFIGSSILFSSNVELGFKSDVVAVLMIALGIYLLVNRANHNMERIANAGIRFFDRVGAGLGDGLGRHGIAPHAHVDVHPGAIRGEARVEPGAMNVHAPVHSQADVGCSIQ